MPAANVRFPLPLTRLNPFYPGQMGVPGGWTETGLRQHCTGTVFYVDPNYPGVSDQRDGTDPTDPLQTVATALTRCQAYRGDVIAVMANNDWYYGNSADGYTTVIAEEVTVTVPGVRIVGVAPSSTLGVMWTPASDGGTCITVHALDVVIEGFVFTEGNTYTGCNAIYCEWDVGPLYGENLTVRHCLFDDTVDIAVQLEYSWYCDIHHNFFQECDTYGVYTDAGGSGTAYSLFHHNRFMDIRGTAAIALLGGADNNFIYNNWIYNTDAQAGNAATNEGINTTGGRENVVCHNVLSCALPGPGAGDYNDFCTAAGTDAWIQNYCLNGPSTTNPT